MSAVAVLSAEDLERIVRAAVRAELAASSRSEWMGPDELCELLGIERPTLPAIVKRDGLPAAKVGRAWRARRADVDAWLESRIQRPGGHARKHGATLRALRGGKP